MKNLALAASIFLALWNTTSATAATAAKERSTHGAKQIGDSARGEEIATRWCVNCHKVDIATDDRIPSLTRLAATPARTDGIVRAFLMQPHKPMPPLELGTQQIEDILAYLHTLSTAPAASRTPSASP